jgi:4-hydroxybenzoate polyprenyltransferase
VELARVDHWFKNIFVLPGMVAAFLLEPGTRGNSVVLPATLGLLATCLIASRNYVLNEVLDARTDRFHPSKKKRPMVAGSLSVKLALVEWLALAAAGFALGGAISSGVLWSLAALWIMALIYNVPPLRAKEVAYLDVLSEAINNPIRLLLGWYAVGAVGFPPSSSVLLLAHRRVSHDRQATRRAARHCRPAGGGALPLLVPVLHGAPALRRDAHLRVRLHVLLRRPDG